VANNSVPLPVGLTRQLPSGKKIKINLSMQKFYEHYLQQNGNIYENYSPVAIKKLGSEQQNNIIITGDFSTDFDPDVILGYDGMAYITVRRNSIGVVKAQCGYGVAFRPSSPGTTSTYISEAVGADNGDGTVDVIINSTTGFSVGGGLAYIAKTFGALAFHYASVDGAILRSCYFPNNVTPEVSDVISNAANNVFIVDNDMVGSDIYNHHQIESDTGVMSYVKAAVSEIKKDTRYYYQLTISDNNAISFKISETEAGVSSAVDIFPLNSAYTPLAEYLETPNMDAFGYSVSNTRGYKWYWGALKISNLNNEYPAYYFEMFVNDLPDKIRAYIRGVGEGYNGDDKEYGINLYIWNSTAATPAWEVLSSNEATTIIEANNPLLISEEFDKSVYAEDNIIKFYCTPKYPSGSSISQDSIMIIDTFYLMASVNNSVHMGSCLDIYIDDQYIKKNIIEVEASKNYMSLSEMDDHAVVYIDSVSLVAENSDIELVEGIDYIFYVNDENYRNSTRVIYLLKLLPEITGTVKITYYYSQLVKALQSDTENIYSSFKGQDILVKHHNIHMLSIASGVIGAATYLADYIDTLQANADGGYSLEWTKFKQYMEEEGKTVTTLSITDSYRDGALVLGNYINSAGSVIEITKLEAFKIKEILDAE